MKHFFKIFLGILLLRYKWSIAIIAGILWISLLGLAEEEVKIQLSMVEMPEERLISNLESNYGIQFKLVVWCQVLHETGNLKSEIYKQCFNPLGMKRAYKRQTTSVGTCRGHALFESYDDAFKDYKFYQDWYIPLYEKYLGRPLSSDEDYFNLLEKYGYATDEQYVKKLKKFYPRVKALFEPDN